jgi:hypothetical protein
MNASRFMREQLEVYYLRSSRRSACVSYQFWAAGFELEEHLIFPAAERLTLDANGDLLYTFTRPWSDGTTGIKLSPLELLEKLSALVPQPRVHQVRYAGCLAAHSNLRGAITPTPSHRGIETQASPVASRWAWARLLKRVFALDLERCSRCHSGTLQILTALTYRPVMRRLWCHLKLAADPYGPQLLYLLVVKAFPRLRPHDDMAHTTLDIRPRSRHNRTEKFKTRSTCFTKGPARPHSMDGPREPNLGTGTHCQ